MYKEWWVKLFPNLSKLTNAVGYGVAKKSVYDKLVAKTEVKELVKQTDYNTKITDTEIKLFSFTGLVTTAAVNTKTWYLIQKILSKHSSCEFRSESEWRKFNSRQKWNTDMCHCEW